MSKKYKVLAIIVNNGISLIENHKKLTTENKDKLIKKINEIMEILKEIL